ncbi:MAG: dynamin family protein [Methylococcales bacterium]|nr:dynamin family protein [Methylococcales bacterium]
MKQHPTAQYPIEAHDNINIFDHLTDHARQIEQHWTTIFQGICEASEDHPHLDINHFNTLNDKFTAALDRLHSDLQSPTLILATTGTTSSGKSTIVNLLCGADLMPRMAQEMSAGVVYIHHSPDNKRHLNVHKTDGALWECGQWHDLSEAEIRDKLTKVMDEFNKSKGINQPATPHIELTYPLACFNNPDLLALSSLPKSTQFKLMDLPGLRNHQDNTNAEVIKNCRDALCLVAYNMEETDENRRLELVQQILQQIKHMGGSPARMLFVLNRIDVFHKDGEGDRRRDEHISKVKAEITGILHKELPEHRDTLDNLTYSPLSSLPALHAQRIKTDSDRVHAADELDTHFNSLIPPELIDDLPRRISAWNDRDFQRISDVVWQNSYGEEFFASLDRHIQGHFPTLVIPTIVQNFEKEVSDAIDEMVLTCYSQLNSSGKAYEKAEELLHKQNAELREFLDKSRKTLIKPFDYLAEELKKTQKSSMANRLELFVEDLLETEIYQGRLTEDKLSPLFDWEYQLRTSASGVLDAMKNSLDKGYPYFQGTSVEMLPKHLQDDIATACKSYSDFSKHLSQQEKDEKLDGGLDSVVNLTFDNFLEKINKVVPATLKIQSELENKRIHDTLEILMKQYLNYLRSGIEYIAPEWSLSISDSLLDTVETPKIEIELSIDMQNKTRKEGIGWTLWILKRTIEYKTLPDSATLHKQGMDALQKQLPLLIPLFYDMIHNYIIKLNHVIAEKQSSVAEDFENKLNQAHNANHQNHEKTLQYWQPLHEQSEQLSGMLKQFKNWEGI